MNKIAQKIVTLIKATTLVVVGSIGWILLIAIILIGFSFSWYTFDAARSTEHGI